MIRLEGIFFKEHEKVELELVLSAYLERADFSSVAAMVNSSAANTANQALCVYAYILLSSGNNLLGSVDVLLGNGDNLLGSGDNLLGSANDIKDLFFLAVEIIDEKIIVDRKANSCSWPLVACAYHLNHT